MWFDQEEESGGYTSMVGDLLFAAITIAIATVAAMGVWILRSMA